MGGLNEYLNLGGVEAAEPEQEARKATAVYARSFLECAEPPTCVDFADEEERRFRFIPFETKFTDDDAELRSDPVKFRPTDESPIPEYGGCDP